MRLVPRRIVLGPEAERKEDAFRQRPDREDIGFLPLDELRLAGVRTVAGKRLCQRRFRQ
jgi:hypothetical protein